MQILIIQTAFIGDVVLATPVAEKLHSAFPEASIDFLLRKGNEGLLEGHPFLREIIIWDKKQGKYRQLCKVIRQLRSRRYDYVINLQRFLTTGIITAFSGGNVTIGFDKNPLSVFFTKRYPHIINTQKAEVHEVDRNLSLLKDIIADHHTKVMPKLYPRPIDFEAVKPSGDYITISPTSVWFTKQYPADKWIAFINKVPASYSIYLLGGKPDTEACNYIKEKATHTGINVLAGQLSFLASVALMKNAHMNYVNDSAPMHFASAVDAPVTAIFCSTIPAFGFGPLSTRRFILEASNIPCRPCGLHGYKNCPQGHFACAEIKADDLLKAL
jgi:heptosyltransferase-2